MNGRPLADGRWLLEHRGRRWTAPADVARRWLRDGPPADVLASPRRRAVRRPRLTLAPARLVACAGGRLAPAAAGPAPVLWGLGGLLAVGSTLAVEPGPAPWPAVLAWVLALAAVHELGHAAGLICGGGRPGAVGVGWAVAVPVLWCDVSEVALLPPRARVRTDLAGPALQLGAAGAAALAGAGLERGDLLLAGRAAALAALVSLLPLARTDGGWALADALDLPDLTAPLPADAGPARRRAARVARLTAAVAPGLLLGVLAWRGRGLIALISAGPPLLDGAAGLTGILALAWTARVLVRRGAALMAADRTTRRRSPCGPPA